MKHCPQCGAEYDDFVQYCFVDGVELREGAGAAAKPQRTPTPLPAPSHDTSLPASPNVRPALAPPKPPPTNTGRGVSVWAAGLLVIPVIALFAIGGLLGAVFLFGPKAEQTAQPAPVPARPPPVPASTAVPNAPAPPSVVLHVQFESDPSGAEIWEQDRVLCTTPCVVEHPDYAPPQRSFVLKLQNYQDTPYTMTDPSAVQRVELSRSRSARPRSKPGGDDILNER